MIILELTDLSDKLNFIGIVTLIKNQTTCTETIGRLVCFGGGAWCLLMIEEGVGARRKNTTGHKQITFKINQNHNSQWRI